MLLMSDSSTVHLNYDQYSFRQLVSSIWRQTQVRDKCVRHYNLWVYSLQKAHSATV